MSNPTEKIYITYKTRMFAEDRLLSRAKFFYFLMPWYSFWLLVGSVFQLSGMISSDLSGAFLICLAIGVFGFSIHVGSGRDRLDAAEFKACYLKLKEIYDDPEADHSSKMGRYNEILTMYDNQNDSDYDEMLYDSKCRGVSLKNSYGYIVATDYVSRRVFWKRFGRRTIEIALVFLPIIFSMAVLFVESSNASS